MRLTRVRGDVTESRRRLLACLTDDEVASMYCMTK